jgi:hypothetical protein
MKNWRIRDLFRESVGNDAGSRGRTLILGGSALLVVGALFLSDLLVTGGILDFQRRYVESGGNLYIASSKSGLDAARCAALVSLPGVKGSAAVSPGPRARVLSEPGTLYWTGIVTMGAIRLLTTASTIQAVDLQGRVLVGADAAQELGVVPGSWLGIEGTKPKQVGAVVDSEDRDPALNRWIAAVAAPIGLARECWVEFDAGVKTGRQETMFAMFTGPDVVVQPVKRLDEFSRDPVGELAGRPQTIAWLYAGLLLALLGWLSSWFRRSDVGLYRAVGTGSPALLVIAAGEFVIPVVVGALGGALWALAWWMAEHGNPTSDQLYVASRTAASIVLLAVTCTPLSWIVLGRESIATQLKDR